jgi:3-oxoacyl-[acyl-carrier-protein] synthase II
MSTHEQTKVVVTGLGATTPLGGTAPSTWSAMLAGKSGIIRLTEDWILDMPSQIVGALAVDTLSVMDRVEARRLDRSAQMAMIATREAWIDAGSPELPGERIGAVVASGIGGVTTLLNGYDTLKEKGYRRISPLVVPMLMPNGPAAAVGIEVNARAGVHTPVSACASGAEAVGYGLNMIRSGRADVVVAGGTEAAIHVLPMAGFSQMMALSTRNDEPTRASRPYDKGRNGFVLAEGAGILVLESEEFAKARGARIYAEIAGIGITSDAHHMAQPEPDGRGVRQAIEFAMSDGGLTPADIVHLNAHATSTAVGDLAESKGVRGALGDDIDHVLVSATKSMTGHLLGGAGAVESIATIMALYERVAPPTINLDDPDDEIILNIVRNEARELPSGQIAALNNSFGFGGHNVVLSIRSV